MVNSYRNTISEWAVVFRYENFFIPRVEKASKISPWEKNLASRRPTALGRTKFFALGLIFEDFPTLGMKKFPYLTIGPFGNPIIPNRCVSGFLPNLHKKSENLFETAVFPVVTPLMSGSFTTYYSHVRALGFRGMYETLA